MAGLWVGQACGVLLLPGFGFSSSSPQVPGHPTSICDAGVNTESNTYHRPKPDRQPMTYYTTHQSVLCIANIIRLNQISLAA